MKEIFNPTKKQIEKTLKNFGKQIGKCERCGTATYSKKAKLCSYHERVAARQRTTSELIMD